MDQNTKPTIEDLNLDQLATLDHIGVEPLTVKIGNLFVGNSSDLLGSLGYRFGGLLHRRFGGG
mgnify:CR=1 FL=1